MSKLCPSCGFENDDNAKFCKKCGTALPNDSDLNKKDISSSNANLNDNKFSSGTNKNKSSNNLLIIAIVAIFCVVVAGALILSGGGDQVATVGGIDFNVPEGFTENEDYSMDHEYYEESDFYESYTALEEDSGQNVILVSVIELEKGSVDEDFIAYLADSLNGRRKTINGHSGYIANVNSLAGYVPLLDNGDDLYGFFYEENGKMIIIASNDTSYFEDVII